MLSSQLQNAVIELLSQFISADFGNLEKLRESHETASQGEEHGGEGEGGREGGREGEGEKEGCNIFVSSRT